MRERQPAPSDKADLDTSSWRASDDAMKVSGSVLNLSRRDTRGEMRGVMSLLGRWR